MIILNHSNPETQQNYVSQLKTSFPNALFVKDQIPNLATWRSNHPTNVVIVEGFPNAPSDFDMIQRDLHSRGSTPNEICFLPSPNTIRYDTTFIITDSLPRNRTAILSLDPGEVNMGVSIILINNGSIERIYVMTYNIIAMRDKLDIDSKAGIIIRDNESIKHLFHIVTSFGYKLVYVVIELQDRKNTKASALQGSIAMLCQLMNYPVRIAHAKVKFTLLRLETPTGYKDRKAATTKMMQELIKNKSLNIHLGLPNFFIYNQLEGVIQLENKLDDMADSLIQGLTISIKEKYITSLTNEALYNLVDPRHEMTYSTKSVSALEKEYLNDYKEEDENEKPKKK